MQLSGELAKVSLPNLLQLVKTGAFTGKFSFHQGARYAIVLVSQGFPVHAELEDGQGIDALMELFLWTGGSFSFHEEKVDEKQTTIFQEDPGETFELLLRNGVEYARYSKLLDDLNVSPETVLAKTGTAVSVAKQLVARPGLEHLDGVKDLEQALGHMGLSRRQFVVTVASWLADGLAEIANPEASQTREGAHLPSWVIARLKQDNADITQAIIDMVIWVDRVKCWMYQTDAEFYEMRRELELITGISLSEDFDLEESETSGNQEAFLPPEPPASTAAPSNSTVVDTIFKTPTSNPSSLSGFNLGSSFNLSEPGTGRSSFFFSGKSYESEERKKFLDLDPDHEKGTSKKAAKRDDRKDEF
ncbi:MAG: DUF4388 domain-containing protein [Candidatus Obscuribacterales bacterium]|nr:DUF4388 domain-containing protein [Candidatus Obscuribacterales bacterium]